MKLIIDIYDNDYENIKEYETIFDEKGDSDEVYYERAIEQLEHDILYEPTYNVEDGSL